CVEQDDKGWDARKRAYCLKTQPATGETYPKSDLFNKAPTALSLPCGPAIASGVNSSRTAGSTFE
ncbi:hypothetical protein OFO37_22880, partial [Escherichia coli]|nr:hypothetical protein [Escherichia coli]